MHTFKKQRKEPLRPPFGKQNIKAEEVRKMVGNYIGIHFGETDKFMLLAFHPAKSALIAEELWSSHDMS